MTATTGKQPAVSNPAQAVMDSVENYLASVLPRVRPLPPRPLSRAEADAAGATVGVLELRP
jgi:hypothetical protein